MARVKQIFRASDFPGTPDEPEKKALDAYFKRISEMFPGKSEPEIPGPAAAFAIVAQNPQLAQSLMQLSDYILFQMPWTSERKDLKQLAIQTLNLHYKCDNSFQSHIASAQRDGLRLEQLALIPFWRTANVFNDEQRLVIEYTFAVVKGEVPEELFARVVEQYGEKEAIEFTVAIGWWSLWAMLINATGADFDFGYGNSRTEA
jgi:alkylhydroperoxidase family enzyme